MGRLIVCCDGTWNTPEMPSVTNVRRLHSLLDDTPDQRTFYASGVGTTGSLLDRLEAGTTGSDLDEKILDAYRWLVTRYRPGDEIALFGFSRGAYTVRSLAGLIGRCGLIDTDGLDAGRVEDRIDRLYSQGYRTRTSTWRDGLRFAHDPADGDIPVRFIGVWDTVGALGIPENLGFLRPGEMAARTFHDLDLDRRIPAARQALALDEMRGPFRPALWNDPGTPTQDIRQVWFAGSHMDVGGGHAERGLADVTLEWMLGEIRACTSIGFADPKPQIAPDPLDVLHDDERNLLGPGLSLALDDTIDRLTQLVWDSRPRRIPVIDGDHRDERVHGSVYERQAGRPIASGPYRPTTVLSDPGDAATVDVAADEPWNATGLYLEPGLYEFSATGVWRDDTTWSCAGGTDRTALTLLKSVGGPISRFVRTLAGVAARRDRDEWTLVGEARQRGVPWMRLVGTVANEAGPRRLGSPAAHQVVDIGELREDRVGVGGYLYAYANDAWGSYADNVGTVRLTVVMTAR